MRAEAETPSFEAVIVPHRSLSRRELGLLFGAIALICAVDAAIFVRVRAWPVGAFTGVELILAAVLLRLNARGARASELVLLTPSGLRVVRTDPRGRRTERVLRADWLNVVLEERPGRVPTLLLTRRGEQEEIAAALGEADKRDLAAALSRALYDWRNPRFDNPQLRD
jgi:uncharacterized membrane protein